MTSHTLTLPPCAYADGAVRPPGSKSLANRALPLAAMAEGKTVLTHVPDGEDVALMREALHKLGVQMTSLSSTSESLTGPSGPWSLQALADSAPIDLFLGNSGTSMRILAGLLCGARGRFTLDGVPRMRERPIRDLVDALLPLCGETRIEYAGQSGFPPLRLDAKGLRGGKTAIQGNVSSQFLTGLLLGLPLCREEVTVEVQGKLVSAPYVAMTLAAMRDFGVTVENDSFRRFHLKPGQHYQSPGTYAIEPDASSASYFLAAGAIAGGCIQVTGLDASSQQGETQFAAVLERMGARVTWGQGTVTVRPPENGKLRGLDIDMDLMSDTGMTLAVTALFAVGRTRITGIGNWRVKETDRIEAMATELRKVGAQVASGPDWLEVHPPAALQTAAIDTYRDHRMAMCFSLICLGGVPITLRDPGCVAKTYPGYFEALRALLRTESRADSPLPEFVRT